jgi:hypothetical protein
VRGPLPIIFGIVIAALGVAIVIQTLAAGHGLTAGRLILGVLFVAAGVARIVLERTRSGR